MMTQLLDVLAMSAAFVNLKSNKCKCNYYTHPLIVYDAGI